MSLLTLLADDDTADGDTADSAATATAAADDNGNGKPTSIYACSCVLVHTHACAHLRKCTHMSMRACLHDCVLCMCLHLRLFHNAHADARAHT